MILLVLHSLAELVRVVGFVDHPSLVGEKSTGRRREAEEEGERRRGRGGGERRTGEEEGGDQDTRRAEEGKRLLNH
jgi:hypothetical protein